jgi:phospholipid/cholesterol/gamma-HCH transport system ATP-binding protein
MAEPVIRIEGLTTRLGGDVIHEGIDLEVYAGEVLALIGGSGSGKTTLLRVMLGLEKPARGKVEVLGHAHHGSDPCGAAIRARWGVLFQQGALFSALSVFDNVALPLREMRLLPEPRVRETVMVKLDMVEIGPESAFKLPAELSGGMVKRVALARALVLEPELLLLDEPTAGLDPQRSRGFVGLIQCLRRRLRLTVVMATHDVDVVLALADRVAVLEERKLVAVGVTDDIAETRHRFVRSFFRGRLAGRLSNSIAGSRVAHPSFTSHAEFDQAA